MSQRLGALARLAVLGLLQMAPGTALAHGFGQRFDLPVPLDLYLFGSAATVGLSFAAIALFVRTGRPRFVEARLDLLRVRGVRLLVHPALVSVLQLASAVVFVLLLAAGAYGVQDPARNVLPTMVWIIWWTGLGYVSALVGDLWALINPWSILYGGAEALYRRLRPGRELGLSLAVPPGLGVWPAFGLFVWFVWGELVWENNAIPASLARAAVVYSALTWAGMFCFGRYAWLRAGETFSVIFGLLARFAPTEIRVIRPALCAACTSSACRGGGECVNCVECISRAAAEPRSSEPLAFEWNLRPFAVGLLSKSPVSLSQMAIVVLMLSTVSFDGFMATPLWRDLFEATTSSRLLMPGIHELNMAGMSVDAIVSTAGLVIAPLLFLLVYALFSRGMALAAGIGAAEGGAASTGTIARGFVLSLIPIAIAYHLAHYLSFLFIAGQLVIPLASDPFGFGWDLLGTAAYQIDVGIIGARSVWYTSVAAVVAGHVIAVFLAHVESLRLFASTSAARKSQYPMLVLMVSYTFASLWILAQPIVE